MRIKNLQDRLRDHIRDRIAKGQLAGVDLSKLADFPQGHLSNFLNSRRGLSLESMDRLLGALAIGVMDLVTADEIQQWFVRPASRSRYDVVPRISGSIAMMPQLPRNGVLVDQNPFPFARRIIDDEAAVWLNAERLNPEVIPTAEVWEQRAISYRAVRS